MQTLFHEAYSMTHARKNLVPLYRMYRCTALSLCVYKTISPSAHTSIGRSTRNQTSFQEIARCWFTCYHTEEISCLYLEFWPSTGVGGSSHRKVFISDSNCDHDVDRAGHGSMAQSYCTVTAQSLVQTQQLCLYLSRWVMAVTGQPSTRRR
jgi:hypothetical protein